MVDASRKTSAAAPAKTRSDGEDETRAKRAEKAAMAAKANATQGQRPVFVILRRYLYTKDTTIEEKNKNDPRNLIHVSNSKDFKH